jgi:hypothetical protein
LTAFFYGITSGSDWLNAGDVLLKICSKALDAVQKDYRISIMLQGCAVVFKGFRSLLRQ